MTLPTVAVRNAIAAVALTGDAFPHTSMSTRLALWDYSEFNNMNVEDIMNGVPFRARRLTKAGTDLLAKAPLWKCAKFLMDKGYKLESSRRHKPGFVCFNKFDEETGKLVTAYISSGKSVYEREPTGHRYTNTFSA